MTSPVVYVSVNVPFPGLYESILSGELDRAEEMNFDDDASIMEEERTYPEALRLTSDELAQLGFDAMDYGAAHLDIAKRYAESFDYVAGEWLGLARNATRKRFAYIDDASAPNGYRMEEVEEAYRLPTMFLQFEEMTSPREYNFTTDRLFCKVPLAVMQVLFNRSARKEHTKLAEVIEERHSSRSGFHSFYSDDLDSWLAKPLADWDENEMGTLLRAAMRDTDSSADSDHDDDDGSRTAAYGMAEGEAFYQVVDSAMDWDKLEESRRDARAEKLEELKESDPDAAAEIEADAAKRLEEAAAKGEAERVGQGDLFA